MNVGSDLLELNQQATSIGTDSPTCGEGLDLSKLTNGNSSNQIISFTLTNGAAFGTIWGFGSPINNPATAGFYGGGGAAFAPFAGNPLCIDNLGAGAPKTNGLARRVLNAAIVVSQLVFTIPVGLANQRTQEVNLISQNYNLDNANEDLPIPISWNGANGFINSTLIPCDEFSGFQYRILPATTMSITAIYSLKQIPFIVSTDEKC